jgi:peptide chain release factor 1
MFEKLAHAEERYEELNTVLSDPDVASDYVRANEYAQERAELEDVVNTYRRYKQVQDELSDTRSLLQENLGSEMSGLAQEEIVSLEEEAEELERELRTFLLPKDPNEDKNVIVEIRAGTGGEEAALFAGDLYRMYSRYAENKGWKTQILSSTSTGIGGFKEVIFLVEGRGAYSHLKYESGVHRVQRVPLTEASGRIHTSAATVAILPEMDEVEVTIAPEDLRIDVYRSAGHGGQSVNTTDSAVRITHLPTGLVVTCQDERSQLQNKLRAMAILRARLYDLEQSKQLAQVEQARRSQVRSGDRSEKIRTYNFPQNRVTDHRIGLTSHRLEAVLNGELDEFVYELASADQAIALQEAG